MSKNIELGKYSRWITWGAKAEPVSYVKIIVLFWSLGGLFASQSSNITDSDDEFTPEQKYYSRVISTLHRDHAISMEVERKAMADFASAYSA